MSENTSKLDRSDVIALRRGVRMQFEPTQNSWVLLYPEGMVQLSETAGEILKRVDGTRRIAEIIGSLDDAYNADTSADIVEFLEMAHEHRWIERSAE